MVAAVSVTLAAWVIACCLTPSMFALISFTALAVSVILEASSFPISSIVLELTPTCWMDAPIFAIVSLKYSAISVISSLPCTGRRTVKSPSPCAIFRSAATIIRIGFITARATKYTITSAINRMTTPIPIIEIRNALTVSINSSWGAAMITVQSVVFIVAYEAIFLTPLYS